DVLPFGQRLAEDPGLDRLLDDALAALGPKPPRPSTREGVRIGRGVSTFFHGSGFTGSGEVKLGSGAALALGADGHVRVLAASTDIGQGTTTVFAQIVADRLGIALEDVEVAPPDTSVVPDSGPTVASRTVMVVGGLLDGCAADLAAAVGARDGQAFREAARAYVAAGGKTRF